MGPQGISGTDGFELLDSAIANKDERDWTERIYHFFSAYGFDKQFPNDLAMPHARWLVSCLRGGGPRLCGLDADESPLKAIIKIEAGMIIQQETVFSEDEEGSTFFPWMGGRWEKAAICLLSILNKNSTVKQYLDEERGWLTIPSNLDIKDYIQVIPVIKYNQDKVMFAAGEVETEVETKGWPGGDFRLTLRAPVSSREDLESFGRIDLIQTTWISICQPISKWEKDPDKGIITIPSKRWTFASNKVNRYYVPNRGV
jgi:hypothetical protein